MLYEPSEENRVSRIQKLEGEIAELAETHFHATHTNRVEQLPTLEDEMLQRVEMLKYIFYDNWP